LINVSNTTQSLSTKQCNLWHIQYIRYFLHNLCSINLCEGNSHLPHRLCYIPIYSDKKTSEKPYKYTATHYVNAEKYPPNQSSLKIFMLMELFLGEDRNNPQTNYSNWSGWYTFDRNYKTAPTRHCQCSHNRQERLDVNVLPLQYLVKPEHKLKLRHKPIYIML